MFPRCLVAAALVLGLAPGSARAESALWTLTASPLAVITGVGTTFSLIATNEDVLAETLSSSRIGCLWVDVPSNFSVAGASVTGSTPGDSWVASLAGNRVRISATSGGDRLRLMDSVSFAIRATALGAGSLTWNANAYREQDCSGSGALVGVRPVVVVSDPVATSTPTPTPAPPSATPTPTPTPLVTLPTLEILPTPTSMPTPTWTAIPTPANAPGTSPTPTPSSAGLTSEASPGSGTTPGTASPSEGDGESSTPATAGRTDGTSATAGSGDAGGPVTGPRVSFDRTGLGVELGAIGLLDGAAIWAVPAATIAGPGLLILLFIALQAAGVAAWIPAVRRLRGKDERPS